MKRLLASFTIAALSATHAGAFKESLIKDVHQLIYNHLDTKSKLALGATCRAFHKDIQEVLNPEWRHQLKVEAKFQSRSQYVPFNIVSAFCTLGLIKSPREIYSNTFINNMTFKPSELRFARNTENGHAALLAGYQYATLYNILKQHFLSNNPKGGLKAFHKMQIIGEDTSTPISIAHIVSEGARLGHEGMRELYLKAYDANWHMLRLRTQYDQLNTMCELVTEENFAQNSEFLESDGQTVVGAGLKQAMAWFESTRSLAAYKYLMAPPVRTFYKDELRNRAADEKIRRYEEYLKSFSLGLL